MKYLLVSLVCLLSSCSYNVSMAHTSGMAEDVIDDTSSNTSNISPKITLPLTSDL